MSDDRPVGTGSVSPWILAALLVGAAGTAGSLWLSIGMGLKACPLCLYQRSFIMSAVAVLVVGLCTRARHSPLLPLVALPPAFAGLGVALFHVYLETIGKLECPGGLLGAGTAPQQSLLVFVLFGAGLLLASFRGTKQQDYGLPAVAGSAVLGLLLAAGTVASAPPMPAPPSAPYDGPMEICRPPFRGQS